MKKEINDKLKDIRLIISDLEGVLLTELELNDEIISRLVKNIEKAITEFKKRGLNFAIITARQKDELINELEKIKDCIVISSTIDKVSAAEKILKDFKLECKNILFIGDGILDIPLLKKCGVSVAPKKAKREVKREVDFIIKNDNCEIVFDEIFKILSKLN
ncbi:MAG: HAD hydrolase family protein [Melioribacter sp.]|nr:HAD hydrolase family protein [Melioribacter sp.]